jgi:hypothetical protein
MEARRLSRDVRQLLADNRRQWRELTAFMERLGEQT